MFMLILFLVNTYPSYYPGFFSGSLEYIAQSSEEDDHQAYD